MEKKCILVFYKDIKRKISYFGSFNEKAIKSSLKTLYHIKEPIEQIFFTDDEGDIVVLEGDNVPNELKVHLYIEYDSIPKNPENELEIKKNDNSNSNLLEFHWVIFDKTVNPNDWIGMITENKYTYKAINNEQEHPEVVSSVSFTKGRFFFVIRKGVTSFYSALCVIDSEYQYEPSKTIYNCDKYIGLKANDNAYETQNIGVFIDTINKKVEFYDYDRKKLLFSYNINFESAKFIGWIKGKNHADENGYTILNKGCIPIPDWVKY
jgi:hypothetical protein